MSESLSATLDHLSEGRRPWLLLAALCLALYLPGIVTLPVTDRDEARFVQASRQMLETHDFVRIRYQDEARNKKPVGIYWLQAASVAAFSTPESSAIWPYRLVSLAGAIGAVLLLFHFGAEIFDRRTALLGAGLAASSADAIFEAHIATTDAVLLAAAVAAQGALAITFLAPRRGDPVPWTNAACFWCAQAVAILIKGPVVPVMSICTILLLLVFERRAAWLQCLRTEFGLPLMLILVLPWFVLIERATGGAFLREALGHDLLGKVVTAQEAHGALPGYYLSLVMITFWPGSLFLGLGAIWAWRHRRLAATRFLAAWILPFWLILELVPTKLPHYALPLYPALALICARAIVAHDEGRFMPRPSWWIKAPAILWSLVTIGVAFGLLGIAVKFDASFMAKTAAVIGAGAAAAVIWHLWQTTKLTLDVTTPLLSVIVALFVIVPGLAIVLPGVPGFWLSAEATRLIAQHRNAGDAVAAVGYAEPSLVFLNGTDTALLSSDGIGAFLAGHPHSLMLVSDQDRDQFTKIAATRRSSALVQGVVSGIDYSNGHRLQLTLYRVDPVRP